MDSIADPVAFFYDLGLLHDAKVKWLAWGEGELHLVVDNLNANFMDGDQPSPDYPGYVARPATVVFVGVQNVAGHLRDGDDYISALEIERLRDCYHVAIVGTDSLFVAFDCTAVRLEPAGEPALVAVHYAALKR